MTLRRALRFGPALWLALLSWPSGLVHAGPVTLKGSVHLPAGRVTRLYQGYWRIENGNVPIQSAPNKAGTVVVLEGFSGIHPPPPRTVTVSIAGLDVNPKVVVVGPGSVVEFRNDGKVTHELSTPADPSVMPLELLNPGAFRHARFNAPGAYIVRCAEYPHIAVTVLVTDNPYFAPVDDHGTFSIANVPEGKATLKVWSNGQWVHEEPVDIDGKDIKVEVTAAKAAGQSRESGMSGPPDGKEGEGVENADNKSGGE